MAFSSDGKNYNSRDFFKYRDNFETDKKVPDSKTKISGLLRLKSDQYPHFIMESVENYWVPTLFNISLFFLCVMNLPLQCFKLSIRCNRMKLLCNSFCSLSKRHCSSNSESSQDAVAIFTDYLLYRRLENSLDVKGSDSPLSGKILQNLKLTKLS